MEVHAYGHNLTKKDKSLILSMIKVVTDRPVKIVDLSSYEVDLSGNLLFLFGKKAAKRLRDHRAKKVSLPSLDLLEKKDSNKKWRELAYQTLLGVNKASSEEKNQILPEELPDFPIEDLRSLERNLKTQGIEEWIGATDRGETISLTIFPKKTSADICLTFSELYAMRMAFSILGMKEIKVTSSTRDKE